MTVTIYRVEGGDPQTGQDWLYSMYRHLAAKPKLRSRIGGLIWLEPPEDAKMRQLVSWGLETLSFLSSNAAKKGAARILNEMNQEYDPEVIWLACRDVFGSEAPSRGKRMLCFVPMIWKDNEATISNLVREFLEALSPFVDFDVISDMPISVSRTKMFRIADSKERDVVLQDFKDAERAAAGIAEHHEIPTYESATWIDRTLDLMHQKDLMRFKDVQLHTSEVSDVWRRILQLHVKRCGSRLSTDLGAYFAWNDNASSLARRFLIPIKRNIRHFSSDDVSRFLFLWIVGQLDCNALLRCFDGERGVGRTRDLIGGYINIPDENAIERIAPLLRDCLQSKPPVVRPFSGLDEAREFLSNGAGPLLEKIFSGPSRVSNAFHQGDGSMLIDMGGKTISHKALVALADSIKRITSGSSNNNDEKIEQLEFVFDEFVKSSKYDQCGGWVRAWRLLGDLLLDDGVTADGDQSDIRTKCYEQACACFDRYDRLKEGKWDVESDAHAAGIMLNRTYGGYISKDDQRGCRSLLNMVRGVHSIGELQSILEDVDEARLVDQISKYQWLVIKWFSQRNIKDGFDKIKNNSIGFCAQIEVENLYRSSISRIREDRDIPTIFISYARDDFSNNENFIKTIAASIVEKADKRGLSCECFYDGETASGQLWRKNILKQIFSSSIVVALVTPQYLKSSWCQGYRTFMS